MHNDHCQWRSENSLWREEVRKWEYDLFQARQDLPRLEKAFVDHEQALEIHAASIRLYEQALHEHEHALAKYEKGDVDDRLLKLSSQHPAEETQQRTCRDRHARIKAHHRRVMKQWRMLLKALEEPV
ncbi:MAG: hypothetical protein DCC67_01695 [Planctomycetota bacterium]|nr:MAG: hypothetical protein DCC67_01695 [Planctomycetota bacterium]